MSDLEYWTMVEAVKCVELENFEEVLYEWPKRKIKTIIKKVRRFLVETITAKRLMETPENRETDLIQLMERNQKKEIELLKLAGRRLRQ